jgi:histidine triad (HIT) family protein
MSCIFCEILEEKAPAAILLRDEMVTAFRDTHPISSTHILVIPNRHIASVNELGPGDENLVGHMVLAAQELAQKEGIAEKGYRLIINTGPQAGQTVYHIHLHLIGGAFTRFKLG